MNRGVIAIVPHGSCYGLARVDPDGTASRIGTADAFDSYDAATRAVRWLGGELHRGPVKLVDVQSVVLLEGVQP